MSATPSPSPEATGPLAALTGMPTSDDDVADRHVLAVKVENTPAARPQSGLEQADVVYEELVEGGLTRFIALFHSRIPDDVGPIRSARLVDIELLPPYQGVLAISGARDKVLRDLGVAGVPFMADGKGFHRISSRRAPHNLYASGAALYARASSLNGIEAANGPWMFDAAPPAGAHDCKRDTRCLAATRDVTFLMSKQSRTGWTWEPATGLYRRSQDGRPFLSSSGEQVGAANVVILAMAVGDGECCDTNGSPLVHTEVTGSGRAVILRDGSWYEATWSKASADAPLELHGAAGEDFRLRPGPTWVHLAPTRNVPDAP